MLRRRAWREGRRYAEGHLESRTQSNRINSRRCLVQESSAQCASSAKTGKLRIPPTVPPPPSAHHGWVSPADPQSNLRTVVLQTPANETSAEQKYRMALDKVQNWNHSYWRHHNMQFVKAREEFIAQRCRETNRPESTINAEDMAVFYKDFLDSHYIQHVTYNRNWYRHNAELVWLALNAALSRAFVNWPLKSGR